MSELKQIKHWRASTKLGAIYERMLGAIGTEEFGSTVRDSIFTATGGARRIYLFEASSREENDLQYFTCEPSLHELLPTYTKSYLQLDPVSDAFRAAPAMGDAALLRIRPSDIASSGFRRRFFDDAGIVERVSVIQRGEDRWRVITVARHAKDGYYSDDQLSALVGLSCLALPMLPLNRRDMPAAQPLSVSQLEDRFGSRFNQLTVRERQVCARAAIGMTVEATALDLGIAKTSVLTYRQRAYQRLSVSSPFELCSLVTH